MLKDDIVLNAKTARISLLHVAVIALSLIMTISAYYFSKAQIEKRTKARFEVSHERVLGLISERMKKYEDALWAGASAVQSHGGDISHGDWKVFAESLNIKEKYPGISGIGVIHYLDPDEIPGYLDDQRAVRPDFRIHPLHEQSEHLPITYIEPEAKNAAAIGLDVAHETNRRTAALASRDTGTAQITGPIVLVQDASSTPGFLFYAPYYSGEMPTTVAQRRAQILGTVYAPFVVRELMEGLLAKEFRQLRFDIRDGDDLIYDEHSDEDALNDTDPMYAKTAELELYGRTWTLDIRTNLAFRSINTYSQPSFILVGGLIIEALIIALLFLMSRANSRAIAYADRATTALRAESEKLADTNLELENSNIELAQTNSDLEQFAYAASHDLKTPVRGIGVLNEMIEDDLEDYFKGPDANPEVRENLTRIGERVGRMNDLINGVMAFSQVSGADIDGGTLSVRKIVGELNADFQLQPGQLTLVGADATVDVDSFNFRRVLENLVSNAVKHGASDDELRIKVSVERSSKGVRVSVADNGPGVDEEFHGRIFDVFQTLRVNGEQESTGIGLAIVKKAVERHHGKVSLISAAGSGATFIFDWPGRKAGDANATSSEAA